MTTLGEMTPAERSAAIRRAADKMQAELRAAAPAISAILLAPAIGDTRACPDCGRPQHYTGTEHGWAHDALIDTWHCAGDRVRANQTSEAGA